MSRARIFLSGIVLLASCISGARAEKAQGPAYGGETEFEIVVPEGTIIPIILTAFLNTRSSLVGDLVYAETVYPVWIQQQLVIPRGTAIRGTVTDVVRPGRIKGKGRLALRIDDLLLPNGVKRDIVASFRGIHGPGEETFESQSETVSAGGTEGRDAGTIIGMTSQGAIIGSIAGRGRGAAIGAGAGAAAGIITTLFTRGRDLVLSPGTQFDLELQKQISFAYNELAFTNAELNRARPAAPPRMGRQNSPTGESSGRRFRLPGPFGIPFPSSPW